MSTASSQASNQQQQQTSSARRATLIQFNPANRWAVSGKTGGGKTVFEKWWLKHWYAAHWPIVVVDIKRKFAEDEDGKYWYAEKPEDATLDEPYDITATGHFLEGCPVMVYHPSLPGWKDPRLNRLLLEILARGNVCLAFDEIAGVADESHCPLGLLLIATQGRQSKIPTLYCFQKPVRIPVDLMEQSEWYAIFRQNSPDYRKKIVDITGFEQLMQRPPQFYYWLAHENWDEPVLMAPVPWDGESRKHHGAKALGASGRRLLDTTSQGVRQGRRQNAEPAKLR